MAGVSGRRDCALDAAGSAILALGAAVSPADARAAAGAFVIVCSLMASMEEWLGPFEEAREALRAALAAAAADDWALRVALMTAMGSATGMRGEWLDDDDLRAESRQVIADAGRLLSGAVPDDRPAEAGSLRQACEQLLAVVQDGPAGRPRPGGENGGQARAAAGEARRLARGSVDRAASALGLGPAGSRRPLTRDGRPSPESLRLLAAELHEALPRAVEETRLRHQVDRLLGLCQAELYWAGARDVAVLQEAIAHLSRALLSGVHALPAIEWADLLGVLARCYREVAGEPGDARARDAAERAARAALQELARCVMIAEGTDAGLAVAARANEVMSGAIGWSLADGRPRVAIDIAEAGRGLVLSSVVLSGQVEEILRGAGMEAVADGWRAGTEDGRVAALNALYETTLGDTLLRTPMGPEISVAMVSTRLDAVIYLVPPGLADDGGPGGGPGGGPDGGTAEEATGHAILVRPVLGEIEVLPLPGLAGAGAAPLRHYMAAFGEALAALSLRTRGTDGFRGGPGGQAWADALAGLGRWAHDRIMGPLIGHVRGWQLDHLPHLALIPLGELAAVPYAAAWTEDPRAGTVESKAARRYAIDDVILSYAGSARLLGEVSRRPRQRLAERVVLVSDPTGEFPMSRRVTQNLASQYRDAEVYGLNRAPNGPATTAVLLGALPGRDRQGASLLQLTTHATTDPVPSLQTRDGWLPLARILEQARGRATDAPGGLVITNACRTDSTRTNYDESLTLATAFLAAGATDVIGTRWPVDDDTTAALNLRLHHHLQVGHLPAEALRRAQLDLLRPRPDMRDTLGPHLAAVADSRLSHPASWAGHVHYGISS
jgi:hypothetical protein